MQLCGFDVIALLTKNCSVYAVAWLQRNSFTYKIGLYEQLFGFDAIALPTKTGLDIEFIYIIYWLITGQPFNRNLSTTYVS